MKISNSNQNNERLCNLTGSNEINVEQEKKLGLWTDITLSFD